MTQRLEYSPTILDDTDRESSIPSIDQTAIEPKESMGGHLDTSRFADIHKHAFDSLTNRSTLSVLVDPREHVRTLKSPLRDRLVNYFTRDRSHSPKTSNNTTHRSSALVVEKSEPEVKPKG